MYIFARCRINGCIAPRVYTERRAVTLECANISLHCCCCCPSWARARARAFIWSPSRNRRSHAYVASTTCRCASAPRGSLWLSVYRAALGSVLLESWALIALHWFVFSSAPSIWFARTESTVGEAVKAVNLETSNKIRMRLCIFYSGIFIFWYFDEFCTRENDPTVLIYGNLFSCWADMWDMTQDVHIRSWPNPDLSEPFCVLFYYEFFISWVNYYLIV